MAHTFNLINSTTNPFINLSYFLAKTNSPIEKDTINLFYSLLNSNLSSQHSLNERFLISSSNYSRGRCQVEEINAFDLLRFLSSNINHLDYMDFFNTLFKQGLSIQDKKVYSVENLDENFETSELNEFINMTTPALEHVVFDRMELDENKNIFFLERILKNTTLENFISKIQEHNSLHRAVILNKKDLIKFICDSGVPINLLDKDNNSPLMFCRNMDTLQLIKNYNPDWTNINVFNEDAYSTFTKVSDNEQRKLMMEYTKIQLETYQKTNSTDNQDYIDQRIRKGLLELVSSDKTKKELQDYIKKYKPKNIGSIYNEEGNNLLMISLKENNWARAQLFLKDCDIKHRNKHNESITEILLQKTSKFITKIDDAIPFLELSLQYNNTNIDHSLFIYLLEQQFNKYNSSVEIPKWIIKDHFHYLELLNIPVEEAIKMRDLGKMAEQENNSNNSFTNAILFYLHGFLSENKPFDFNFSKIVASCVHKNNNFQGQGFNYSFDSNKLNLLFQLIEIAEKENIQFELQQIYSNIYSTVEHFLTIGLSEHRNNYNQGKNKEEYDFNNRKDFISRNVLLLELLIDKGMSSCLKVLPKEVLEYDNINDKIKSAIRHSILNGELNNKEGRTRNKI